MVNGPPILENVNMRSRRNNVQRCQLLMELSSTTFFGHVFKVTKKCRCYNCNPKLVNLLSCLQSPRIVWLLRGVFSIVRSCYLLNVIVTEDFEIYSILAGKILKNRLDCLTLIFGVTERYIKKWKKKERKNTGCRRSREICNLGLVCCFTWHKRFLTTQMGILYWSLLNDNQLTGTAAILFCKTGFLSSGNTIVFCQPNGQWSAKLGECIPNTMSDECPPLTAVNGIIAYDLFRVCRHTWNPHSGKHFFLL